MWKIHLFRSGFWCKKSKLLLSWGEKSLFSWILVNKGCGPSVEADVVHTDVGVDHISISCSHSEIICSSSTALISTPFFSGYYFSVVLCHARPPGWKFPCLVLLKDPVKVATGENDDQELHGSAV